MAEAVDERPGPDLIDSIELSTLTGLDDDDDWVFVVAGGAGVLYCLECWPRQDEDAHVQQLEQLLGALPEGWRIEWEHDPEWDPLTRTSVSSIGSSCNGRRVVYVNELTGERQLSRPTKSAAEIVAERQAEQDRRMRNEAFDEPGDMLAHFLSDEAKSNPRWDKPFTRPRDCIEYCYHNNRETEPQYPQLFHSA